ncbi:MAG: GntR family transcriptional regulator, partial [Comamonadaceae bacterium]
MTFATEDALPLWASLFRLPDQPGLPIQVRLRAVITQAILEGRLCEGAGLPSSRDLSQALSLSRTTVTAAYEQLVEDGFLEARPRKGVFVAVNASAPRADVDAAREEDPF